MRTRSLARLTACMLAIGLAAGALALCCCATDAEPVEATLDRGGCCGHANSNEACAAARLVAPAPLEPRALPPQPFAAPAIAEAPALPTRLSQPRERTASSSPSPSPARFTILRI